MDTGLQREAANYASERYNASLQEIERIRNSIYHNRKGHLPLTEIPQDPDRLARRIQREGLSPVDAIERINGVPNFQDVHVVRQILRLCESVCRISIQSPYGGTGYGTGFLISPNIMITNNHVFPDAGTAQGSSVQFKYELLGNGGASDPVTFRTRPDLFFMTSSIERSITIPFSGLDFTLVALQDKSEEGIALESIPWVKLDEEMGKVLEGENCIVIQHPAGDYKKIVLKDIRMLTLTDNFLIYESDTLPGSSGSMVLGLGTARVVALHHSGVPRRNEKGDWLKKDGTPYMPGDPDTSIDWIGNEGIRISSILKAIRKIEIAPHMEPYRNQIVQSMEGGMTMPVTTSGPGKPVESSVSIPAATAQSNGNIQYFEIELSPMETLRDDWRRKAKQLVPGLTEAEPIFPYASDDELRRYWYIKVADNLPPWELAARIEALPHVESCTPDLPVYTDVGIGAAIPVELIKGQESALKDAVYNDGTAKPNEPKFIKQWKEAVWYRDAINSQVPNAIRHWNWKAVGLPFNDYSNVKDWQNTRNGLKKIKVIQLDTGYSRHSKVRNGYNLQEDMDFIDNDSDASDEQHKLLLKFPSHGTRTASLVIGGSMNGNIFDGNQGLLTDKDGPLTSLIPYRVAKSVILIGRGKQVVDAVNYAVESGADVMFMCMGSYPRPMIARAAKHAYDNGLIWVCAAGNEVEMVVAPALYPGTIAVAASNPDDQPWKGSCYGPAVDISAPGESVYVPFVDEDGNEIMVFGDGTSYAAPHVAAAAALWKAKYADELKLLDKPWKVVESFRKALTATARNIPSWKTDCYGKGILDIQKLLNSPPLTPSDEDYAYHDKNIHPKNDLGIREGIHHIWNTLRKKLTPGLQEATIEMDSLSNRGRIAMEALMDAQSNGAAESAMVYGRTKTKKVLEDYFSNYTR